MAVTAQQVKELRQQTGVGMMECKKALVENDGDIQKSVLWLRERGLSRAAKKSGRAAAEGLVSLAFNSDQTKGVLVELNCETDFAAKNEDFIAFAKTITELALNNDTRTVEALKELPLQDSTVGEQLTQLIARVGENMTLRRMANIDEPNGYVAGYIHMGGTIGSLVGFSGENPASSELSAVAADVAMHIAAAAPKYLQREEVGAKELEQEKVLAAKKLAEEGRPAELIEKILLGQMNKFYSEVCLIDQPFVKEPKQTIAKYVKGACKAKLNGFVRFQLGEGVEVEKTDFAAEVAAQLK